MMFNDKYKIIYVKCPKAAGTSLLQYFTDCKAPNASQYCLRMASYGNATNVQHLLSAWDDYYVFGFARNVLQRAISQYQYLSTFIRKECPGVAWDQFCQDPYVLGDCCIRQRDVDGQRCCTQSPEHQYQHASPQVNCLLTREGKTAVDWVGRVEQFSSDLSDLVAILNARPGVPSLPTVQTSKANYQPLRSAHHRKLRWHMGNSTVAYFSSAVAS